MKHFELLFCFILSGLGFFVLVEGFCLFFFDQLLLAGAVFYLSVLNLDRSLISKEPSSSISMIMLP